MLILKVNEESAPTNSNKSDLRLNCHRVVPHIVGLQTLRVSRERLPRLGKGHAGGDHEAIAGLVGEGDVLRFHCGHSLQADWFLVNTSVYDFLETSFMPIIWTIALGIYLAGEQEPCQPPRRLM